MTPFDFRQRSTEPELMDIEPVSFEEFRACLVDLAHVNRITLAYRSTLAFLDRVRRQRPPDQPLRIVDVGCGYGDMLRAVHAWAARRGVSVSLTGVDLNPWACRAAAEATVPHWPIRWVTGDALAYVPEGGVDVILSSLFTHHLADPALVRFLTWIDANARLGWFINDLHRHPLPYHFFRRYAKLARYHRFIQHDGPVSIARAFTRSDWRRILAAAGVDIAAVELAWRFPFRLTVARVR